MGPNSEIFFLCTKSDSSVLFNQQLGLVESNKVVQMSDLYKDKGDISSGDRSKLRLISQMENSTSPPGSIRQIYYSWRLLIQI